MKKSVKINFRLEKDEDGYPPDDWEGIWASPLGGDKYEVDNIPFFVKGISCGDIIEAEKVGDLLQFQRLVTGFDNSTIRLIIYDLSQTEDVCRRLRGLGCSVEGSGTEGLISIHVPKKHVNPVRHFIRAGFERGEWDYEEGVIR